MPLFLDIRVCKFYNLMKLTTFYCFNTQKKKKKVALDR